VTTEAAAKQNEGELSGGGARLRGKRMTCMQDAIVIAARHLQCQLDVAQLDYPERKVFEKGKRWAIAVINAVQTDPADATKQGAFITELQKLGFRSIEMPANRKAAAINDEMTDRVNQFGTACCAFLTANTAAFSVLQEKCETQITWAMGTLAKRGVLANNNVIRARCCAVFQTATWIVEADKRDRTIGDAILKYFKSKRHT
jgi:hypothetical protein